MIMMNSQGACPKRELREHRVDVLLLVRLALLGLLLPLPAQSSQSGSTKVINLVFPVIILNIITSVDLMIAESDL